MRPPSLPALAARLREIVLSSVKIVVDETRAPVLDPGRGRTKTGYFWAIARDDRPWGCTDPPAVVYNYAPGRGAQHAIRLLDGYGGIVQCDGYAPYKQLVGRQRRAGNSVTLAFCWSHWRRRFYEIARSGQAPIADEVLRRMAALYAIEDKIRGCGPEARRAVRQAKSRARVEALKTWLEAELMRVSAKSVIASAIRYGFNHWDGLGPRRRRGKLGLCCIASRNLQAESRRSAGLSHRRADQARQSLARRAPGRAPAVGMGPSPERRR